MSGAVSFAEILASALIVLGGGFALVGSWGLVRLPSLMERLHGPTKATTLGLGAMLVASVAWFQLALGTWTTHELLISVFLFVTAPISANMIAKVHLHRLRQGEAGAEPGPAGAPAPPPGRADWATHEAPHLGTPGDFEGD
ncbi:Na+/H+ antiporter subunit G [Porphyrobacter sp. CACIAM 03H1]|jgi:multicomponent K+:H+ antiporter subunit G|uniref:Na+/H+ antiporter subunit G n=1 Tax=Porphyrobacter sp. CACIAM 03H1 TaxID=2003315 RepID=UPI000B5A3627|nr:Na+/H+ antiporter subunit G [Porphyrobacter sp. CACIAM 03H1]ASJ89581.1 Na+/H+ antiporter subunit G [Porphyrobacter sp. CACIAM 03H1]